MDRNINQGYHPKAAESIKNFHTSVVSEVSEAVENNAVVVIGMAQNPHIKQAKRALEKNGTAFTYLEYGSYLKGWKPRLAIKMWSGWPTFPQIFVKGKLLGGASDLEKSIESGEFQKLMEESS